MPAHHYRPYPRIELPDRRWPDRVIEAPPTWCSVDLRDGNQALIEPMGPERKQQLFDLLVGLGFREIEVGFPAASQLEFDFVRQLVEGARIPEHVTIQVLTQARDELIDPTLTAIEGARRAIVHLYNSTSALQRRVVFGRERPAIVELAVRAAERIRERALAMPSTDFVFQYTPESFTGTELDFALEICEAVMDVWEPTPEAPMVVNLPATVEMSTPNVYADLIELFGRQVKGRERLILSVHPHNDRGTAVAAAELAVMAGAERVEGTLFGNGERTGNVDLVTLALNLFTQGVDPGLDLSRLGEVVRAAESCTRLPVHPRHPYAGELVYTAFSGSHQDAIKKGLSAIRESGQQTWEVPYLPLDPSHVGRSYDAVIRVNSQSGKGGIAYLLERDHGVFMPRRMQIDFRARIQQITDATQKELGSGELWQAFEDEYLGAEGPLVFIEEQIRADAGAGCQLAAVVVWAGERRRISGRGNGPIDAFVAALRGELGVELRIGDYREHALGSGADASAMAYVEVIDSDGRSHFGAGRDASIVRASLLGVASAANRAWRKAGVARAPRVSKPDRSSSWE
jgi:2-isopropylmalate synthase